MTTSRFPMCSIGESLLEHRKDDGSDCENGYPHKKAISTAGTAVVAFSSRR